MTGLRILPDVRAAWMTSLAAGNPRRLAQSRYESLFVKLLLFVLVFFLIPPLPPLVFPAPRQNQSSAGSPLQIMLCRMTFLKLKASVPHRLSRKAMNAPSFC